MMKKLLASCALVAALTGCVQYPTEKQSVVDTRPSISFRGASEANVSARVIVDNLDMGALGDFVEGRNALRLLPGTHVVRVVLGASVLLEERMYVGDGVNKTLLVQ